MRALGDIFCIFTGDLLYPSPVSFPLMIHINSAICVDLFNVNKEVSKGSSIQYPHGVDRAGANEKV